MTFVRLIYYSQTAFELSKKEVEEILKTARERNAMVSITGCLLYYEDCFLQMLEGSNINVNELYMKIAKDTRHFAPTLLDYSSINKRMFSDWEMGYISPKDTKSIDLFSWCSGSNLDFRDLNSDAALDIMSVIRASM